jgi:hypothetical protein
VKARAGLRELTCEMLSFLKICFWAF